MYKLILILLLNLSHTSLTAQQTTYSRVDSSLLSNYVFCLNYFTSIPSKNIRIKKKEQLIPLTTTPSFWNLFRAKNNWTYKIKISTKSISKLSPILYDKLSKEGKLGVLAHELSHVHDFHNNQKGYLLKVFFQHLSPKKMDEFEYNTDLICIQQGMGNYLYSWSSDVQEKLKIEQWEGKKTFTKDESRERYMRPQTICSYLLNKKEIYADKMPKECIK
jgi:hypothetical protein